MSTLNLGIVAHVDAGKTSLTERLLYEAGIIPAVGSVDKGDTQTDAMELERRRGITIQSAVVSFAIADRTVNLIDTPGHSDFIAEVERAMHVLDGAVLVVSAVEGIQAQTRVLMRSLTSLGIPTVLFVNKIDRAGARYESLLTDIRDKLPRRTVAMSTVENIGTAGARAHSHRLSDPGFIERTAELLADNDDAFLATYLNEREPVGADETITELVRQTRSALVCPVYFGSAVTGTGIAALTHGIRQYLPAAPTPTDSRTHGLVFKVERGRAGDKVAYVRMRAGTLRPRTRQPIHHRNSAGGIDSHEAKISAVRVFHRGTQTRDCEAKPGMIAKVSGLSAVRIGDAIGEPEVPGISGLFGAPTMETVVTAIKETDRLPLQSALRSLAERDPLVDPHFDETGRDITVNLYGEVQKQVIASMLVEEFGIPVTFAKSRTIYLERPVGPGEAVEVMGPYASTHFQATIGLRVEPAPAGSGVAYRLGVERGSLLGSMHRAIEEMVYTTLRQGLYGWRVTDAVVTLTRSGYAPPASTASEFRKLTPLVFMRALQQAGTVVNGPLKRFELNVPDTTAAQVLLALNAAGARVSNRRLEADTCRLDGTIPAAAVYSLEQQLATLAQGKAVFVSTPGGHQPVAGTPPTRPRTDGNPLDRDEYLRYLNRGH